MPFIKECFVSDENEANKKRMKNENLKQII